MVKGFGTIEIYKKICLLKLFIFYFNLMNQELEI